MPSIKGLVFYGNRVSEYGEENNRVDYGTLAKCFNTVLCNSMQERCFDTMEVVQGETENEYGDSYEIFQYYIIDDEGYEILKYWAPDEIVFYDSELGIYVWGVTHFGTGWSYVLTDIVIEN